MSDHELLLQVFHAIYGNGHPGLKSEVAELTRMVRDNIDSQKKATINWQWVVNSIVSVSAVLVAVLK